MKNKIIIVTGIIVILLVIVILLNNKKETLVTPDIAPMPEPTMVFNTPKEVKYDAGTDLKKELDTINPQILDSDFE